MFSGNLLGLVGLNDQMIILVVLALLLFGGKKIPELMRGLGKGLGEFQKGLDEGKREMAKSALKYNEPVSSAEDKIQEDTKPEQHPTSNAS